MRLDRYVGEEPKFRVLRRQPDGSYKEVEPFDYFVLALKDHHTAAALGSYAASAAVIGKDADLAADVKRLQGESLSWPGRKMPD